MIAKKSRAGGSGGGVTRDRTLATDDFITLLAHDLRSPVHTLGMACELLSQRTTGDAVSGHLLEVMHHTLQQMDRLVNDVLALETGEYDEDCCAVESVLQEGVTDQRHYAALRGVQLTLEAPSGECRAEIGRVGLLRIVANLLTNAIRFTPRGGSVRVSAACTQETVDIAIEDDGPGMTPEVAAAVCSGAVSREGRKPMGLILVRHLVVEYGGEMQLHTVPGEGVRCSLSFPRSRRGPQTRRPTAGTGV
jgi:signal transduction histidine kinase